MSQPKTYCYVYAVENVLRARYREGNSWEEGWEILLTPADLAYQQSFGSKLPAEKYEQEGERLVAYYLCDGEPEDDQYQ